MSIKCQHHKINGLEPIMIRFNESSMGTYQYVCARCARIRELGVGRVSSLKRNYGFITNNKKDFFFHFKNVAYDLDLHIGMPVKFELLFLDNNVEAINVQILKRKAGSNRVA